MSEYTDYCGAGFACTGKFFYLLEAINACQLEAEQGSCAPVFPAWLTAALTEAFCSFSNNLTQGNTKVTLDKVFGITAKQKATFTCNGNAGYSVLVTRSELFQLSDKIIRLFFIKKDRSLKLAIKINDYIMSKHKAFMIDIDGFNKVSFESLLDTYERSWVAEEYHVGEDMQQKQEAFLSALPEVLQKEIRNAVKHHSRKPRRKPAK